MSIMGTEFDWKFQSIPQPQLNNTIIPVQRGKVLGCIFVFSWIDLHTYISLGRGSSAMNALIMHRSGKYEYDLWESLGNTGWWVPRTSWDLQKLQLRPLAAGTGTVSSKVGKMWVSTDNKTEKLESNSTRCTARDFSSSSHQLVFGYILSERPPWVYWSYIHHTTDKRVDVGDFTALFEILSSLFT